MGKKIKILVLGMVFIILLSNFVMADLNYGLAPDFNLPDLAGREFSLRSYKDQKPVLLFFWATWCPYCRKELRILNNMYEVLLKDGLEVLAINVGESAYRIDRFIKTYNLTFRILLDRSLNVAEAYNILGIPTYVLINQKGFIVFKGNYFPKASYKRLLGE